MKLVEWAENLFSHIDKSYWIESKSNEKKKKKHLRRTF